MVESLQIELRCNKNNVGTYNAHLYVNGKKSEDAELSVHRGNCDAIALLYAKIKKVHPSIQIRIKGLDKMCMDRILRA